MLAFTIRNTVVVALAQVGIIVAGILGAGLAGKIVEGTPNAIVPVPIQLLVSYGVFLLLLPLIWITVALLVRRNSQCSDYLKTLTFVSGLALIFVLVIFFITVVASPFR